MFRLTLAGPDTHVASSLCAACPYTPAGCCVAPPRYSWSDVARVVGHGGREWLESAVRRGDLVPFEHGLRLVRTPDPHEPAAKKCIFHRHGEGCTIAAERRPATCNYYVCDRALEDGEAGGAAQTVAAAREAHDDLVARFVAWDEALDAHVRTTSPEPRTIDAAFLDALWTVFARLQKRGCRDD